MAPSPPPLLEATDLAVHFPDHDLEVWGHAHVDYANMVPLRDPRPRNARWHITLANFMRDIAFTPFVRHFSRKYKGRHYNLIVATGAVEWVEDMIADRVTTAHDHISDDRIDGWARSALANMASICTARSQ